MIRRSRLLKVLLALGTSAALLAAAGCSGSSSATTTATEGPGNSFDKVTYLTAFGAAPLDLAGSAEIIAPVRSSAANWA